MDIVWSSMRLILCVCVLFLWAGCTENQVPTITRNNPTIAVETETATPTPIPSSVISPSPTILVAPQLSPVKGDPTRASTRVPTGTPTSRPVRIYNSAVSFKTYPFESALRRREDPANHFTFYALDRNAYEVALNTQLPVTKTVRSVVMENEFLRLTFLPEFGGRLFQITFKPTNQDLFYNNRVLKPTNWGPSNQGGWLAVGGMEWALPVNEHGYEWGVPWQATVSQDSNTITLVDTQANNRVRAEIQISLPAHAAYIIIRPRIVNPTPSAAKIQFWINAQIALSAKKNVSPNTEFVLPTNRVFVHSTGNRFIPPSQVPSGDAQSAAAPVNWPSIAGRDMSWYSSWEDYLGLFVVNPTMSFVGAYNHDAELGLARIFQPQQVPGIKLFAFGPKFCCRGQFSDDDSDYFELWGGLPRTFFSQDDVILAPGETREWREYWLPFSRTGGLSYASREMALFVKNENGKASIGIYSATVSNGTLVLLQGDKEVKRWSVSLEPAKPFAATISVSPGSAKLRFMNSRGDIVAEANDPP